MPPPAKVPRDKAIAILLEYSNEFSGDQLPAYNHEIWDKLSNRTENLWSSHNWYVSVKNDRRNILSEMRTKLGMAELLNASLNVTSAIEDENNNSKSQSDIGNDSEIEGSESWFDLVLSPEEWERIKPLEVDNKRTNHTLRPGVWTNIVSIAFWKQFRLPCAFVFKRGEVNVSENRKYFIKIKGVCRSKKCGNRFLGYSDTEPSTLNGELLIRVKTCDTVGVPHENINRPLNGEWRKQIGRAAAAEGASNINKRLARENLKRGDLHGPNNPSLDNIRHAKKEAIDEELGMKREKNEDMIQAIHRMSFEQPYLGSILDQGYAPFYVFYGTSEQRSVYKQYRHMHRKNSVISIDSTGSIVRNLIRPLGLKSAHIFLYTIMVHFGKTSISVFQMLTESQETEKIEFWLRTWQRTVDYRRPNEVVIDGAKALRGACCRAFNDVSIASYISICFEAVSSGKPVSKNLVSTFIRTDTAHFIQVWCRMDCLKNHPLRTIRDFYIRLVAIMMDCQKFNDFVEVLILACVLSLQEFDDSSLELKSIQQRIETTKDARESLESMIAKRPLDIDNFLEVIDSPDVNPIPEVYDAENTSLHVKDFFKRLKSEAEYVKCKGKVTNYYYLPAFAKKLMEYATEFPLWTAVCLPYYADHATSSYNERGFKEVKHEMCKNYSRPLNVDKFLKIHIRHLLGGTRNFAASMLDFRAQGHKVTDPKMKEALSSERNEKSASQTSNHNDSDLQSKENWHNKGECYTRFKCPNLDVTEYSSKGAESLGEECVNETNNIENTKSDARMESDIMNTSDIPSLPVSPLLVSSQSVSMDLSTVIPETPSPVSTKLTDKKSNDIWAQTTGIKKPSQTKFFSSCPEVVLSRVDNDMIEHKQRSKTSNKRRNFLLQNGHLCGTYNIDGSVYFIRNTCPFDSIASILVTTALDDSNYYCFMRETETELFQFIMKFMETGTTSELYKERFILLKPLYENKYAITSYGNFNFVISYDATDSPADVWRKSFEYVPSTFQTSDCQYCKDEIDCEVSLRVNHNIIVRKGFQALQKALNFHSIIYNKKCKCGNTCTQTNMPNHHIYVELEIRANLTAAVKTAQLKEVPTELILDKQYRLVGVISGEGGHFTAYCRRKSGNWQEYNDLKSSVRLCQPSEKVMPIGAIYVLTNVYDPEQL